LLPASALGVTMAREGSAIVVRGDPGVADSVQVSVGQVAPSLPVTVNMSNAVAGAGCQLPGFIPVPGIVLCPLDGVTQVLVTTGDGNDTVAINSAGLNAVSLPLPVPFIVDGGEGDDVLAGPAINVPAGTPPAAGAALTFVGGSGNDRLVFGVPRGPVTADGGEGDDQISGRPSARVGPGPWIAAGGPGNDDIDLDVDGGRGTVDAGPGDDTIRSDIALQSDPAGGDAIDCGPGADKETLEERDVASASCAPHLTGLADPPRLARSSAAGTVRLALGRASKAGRLTVGLFLRGGRVLIGQAKVRLGRGAVSVAVPLNQAGRRALARGRNSAGTLSALAVLVTTDSERNVERTSTGVRLGRARG
jgi:hypothetical protein